MPLDKPKLRRGLLAIKPPSDIVLDVARAVDPTALEAARVDLMNRLGQARQAVSEAFSLAETRLMPGRAAIEKVPGAKTEQPEAFKRFEAMVLQTFIQNMMPKNTESVYGDGMAGDMWKSMMAEQLAGVMAERGGIGIADSLLADSYVSGKETKAIGPITDNSSQKADSDRQDMLSTALIQELQRRIAQSLDGYLTPDEPNR